MEGIALPQSPFSSSHGRHRCACPFFPPLSPRACQSGTHRGATGVHSRQTRLSYMPVLAPLFSRPTASPSPNPLASSILLPTRGSVARARVGREGRSEEEQGLRQRETADRNFDRQRVSRNLRAALVSKKQSYGHYRGISIAVFQMRPRLSGLDGGELVSEKESRRVCCAAGGGIRMLIESTVSRHSLQNRKRRKAQVFLSKKVDRFGVATGTSLREHTLHLLAPARRVGISLIMCRSSVTLHVCHCSICMSLPACLNVSAESFPAGPSNAAVDEAPPGRNLSQLKAACHASFIAARTTYALPARSTPTCDAASCDFGRLEVLCVRLDPVSASGPQLRVLGVVTGQFHPHTMKKC